MSTTADTVNEAMCSLTAAASGAITDYSDVMVRGYLKEHPAVVAHRLDLLAQMIAVVRGRVRAEELSWRRDDVAHGFPLPDPAAIHAEWVAEFTSHDGCCPWCLICRGHIDDPGEGDFGELWLAGADRAGLAR